MSAARRGWLTLCAALLLAVAALCIALRSRQIVMEIGIFSGSLWDVPREATYRWIDEAITSYENSHPGVKVVYRSGTLKDDYSEWLSGKILMNQEPDVFVVLPGDFSTLASLGALMPLREYINGPNPIDPGAFFESAWRLGQLDGQPFALPNELNPELMFVNKSILKAEGIPMPDADWSWDEFYDICRRVTRDTNGDGRVDQFGCVGFGWQLAAATDGLSLFDSRGKQARFNTPEMIRAVRFASSLAALAGNTRISVNDFELGKVAFSPLRFSSYIRYKTYPYRVLRFTDIEWGCIALPKGPNGRNAAQLNGSLWAMSARTDVPDQAWDLLKTLCTDETLLKNTLPYTHSLSAYRPVTDSESFELTLLDFMRGDPGQISAKLLVDIISDSAPTPRFHRYESAMDLADKELYKTIAGEQDVERALSRVQRDVNLFLRE